MEAPAHWTIDVLLADGETMTVRPLTDSDAGFAEAYFARFTPESIYYRFFSPKHHLTASEIEHLSTADHVDRVVLVGMIDDEIIGGARYDRIPDDPNRAEVAFSVVDEHQGRGVATVLLERLAIAGRERGVRCFVAEVLPDNHKMLHVFRDSGFDVDAHFADGVIEVTFPLEPTPASEGAAFERHVQAEQAAAERAAESDPQ